MATVEEDTEWNDILREKGILPPKQEKEIKEEDVIKIVDHVAQSRLNTAKPIENMTLDEIEALEDEEDEKIILEYRQKRLQQISEQLARAKFGDVREISADEYIQEVNKAGSGVWVILHLYQPTLPMCKMINEHMITLAKQFPATKFLKSVATNCIPNYPERNCPSIFIYYEGELKEQIIGPQAFGDIKTLTKEALEWIVSRSGAIKSALHGDPRQETVKKTNFLFYDKSLRHRNNSESDSD